MKNRYIKNNHFLRLVSFMIFFFIFAAMGCDESDNYYYSDTSDTVDKCDTNDTAVYFADPNLNEVVREIIGKPEGNICSSDINQLTQFAAPEKGVNPIFS